MNAVMLLNPGDKALLTCDNWFIGPDGRSYRAVFGTIKAVRTSEKSLGVKTNARSTNWYVEIGDMLVAGCQVHYAIKTQSCDTARGETWNVHEGHTVVGSSPSQVYNADAYLVPTEMRIPVLPRTGGVAGRAVQHVDASELEDTGLPETVWVPWADVVLGQSQHASSTDKEKGALLQVIMLTDEQQAKIDTYVRG